jgi:hypothetical protein
MKVAFELLALFRQKAGAGRLELEVPVAGGHPEVPFGAAPCKAPGHAAGRPEPAAGPTVLEALRAAEARLGGQALLQGERLREGVLVFIKVAGGGTRRVFRPAEERVGQDQTVVLSTAMGGG